MTATARPDRLRRAEWPVVLQYGFRPFFLLAGLHACLFLPLWVLVWAFGWPLISVSDPVAWHAHEMLFGFAAAGLAGFLLTAVPSWTGAAPLHGQRLAILAAAWLLARACAFWPWALTSGLYMAADLGFWLLLAASVAPGILARNARRNGVIVLMLGAMFAANLFWHLDAFGVVDDAGYRALHAGLGLFCLAISVIGGRIVPAFTLGGMRQAGTPVTIVPNGRLDAAAILGLVAAFAVEAAGAPQLVVGLAFAIAALLHGIRLAGWQGWKTLRVPLVWSLHLGYAFLVLGLALKAATGFGLAPPTAGAHALGSGAVGVMLLAVMTRASLGHTGRPLQAPRTAVVAYILVAGGALLRTLVALSGGWEPWLGMATAGLLWAAGYLAYVYGYAPILLGPRIDGRPG